MTARRAALAAAALATAGASVPLVMMVNGTVALGIDYHWWTWPAIPAAWAASLAGAGLSTRYPARGALLLALAAGAGMVFFRAELGLLTFGPAWLLGLYLYLGVGRRAVFGAR